MQELAFKDTVKSEPIDLDSIVKSDNCKDALQQDLEFDASNVGEDDSYVDPSMLGGRPQNIEEVVTIPDESSFQGVC